MVRDDRSIAGRACLALLIGAVTTMSAQAAGPARTQALGLFQAESDIGNVVPGGSAHYDAVRHIYTIASAGANSWYHVDHFNYLWTRASGDLAITARITFPPHRYSHEPNPHRKGLLMFRQSLAPGSAYVDGALHGVGLTALQYREKRGANSPDIELTSNSPQTIRLEKRGDTLPCTCPRRASQCIRSAPPCSCTCGLPSMWGSARSRTMPRRPM